MKIEESNNITLINADVIDGLRTLADQSVHCVITSPPYWGLRDYGTAIWKGGDSDCEHKVRINPKVESSGLQGGKKTTGHQQEGYTGKCKRCGAVRIDRGIGMEPGLDNWIQKIVDVFREVRRVLRNDGTLWLNLGDAYSTHGSGAAGKEKKYNEEFSNRKYRPVPNGLKPKDLIMMPARVALALQEPDWTCNGCNETNHAMNWGRFPNGRRICPACEKSKGISKTIPGWYLRSDIIYSKNNCMPESCRDRPTSSHEHIFLLTKKPRYFFDRHAVREPYSEGTIKRLSQKTFDGQTGGHKDPKSGSRSGRRTLENLRKRVVFHTDWPDRHEGYEESDGRNIRNVWEMSIEPNTWAMCKDCREWYPKPLFKCSKCGGKDWSGHYAAFPSELPMKCIMAGTSEKGCCGDCGQPWERILEVDYEKSPVHGDSSVQGRAYETGANNYDGALMPRLNRTEKTVDWKLECQHSRKNFEERMAAAGRGLHGHCGFKKPDGSSVFRSKKTAGFETDCDCSGESIPCTVLDPFAGSGTTLKVAQELGRRSIGIELNPDYINLIKRRVDWDQVRLFPDEQAKSFQIK